MIGLMVISSSIYAQKTMNLNQNKFTIEVWSDIMCPFCYIGKRNFEKALTQFKYASEINLVWKSYILDPSVNADSAKAKTIYQYLAERKGWTVEYSKEMHEYVFNMAKESGLNYNFDKMIVANSVQAHQIIQYAKTLNLGDKAEEVFFNAYFCEGKDLNKVETLVDLGEKIGLTAKEVEFALHDHTSMLALQRDLDEADKLNIGGVPYFLIDKKYNISGAQSPKLFLETLEKAYKNWKEDASSNLKN
jgi:protein disulfide-isomerase